MSWWKDLKCIVRRNEPLNRHTTFRIGGPARFYIEPYDVADLKLLINALKRYKITPLVIGAGSNILVHDRGVDAAVVVLSSDYFTRLSVTKHALEAGAGCSLRRVTDAAVAHGLSGVEFLAGIPGTVGGALTMNAGAWGSDMSGIAKAVTVMDYRGRLKTLARKDVRFGYRASSLARYIVIGAQFSLKTAQRTVIKSRIARFRALRKKTQDTAYPCAGSVFVNPRGYSAGALIDACGLKGARVGGACISTRHANFIVNQHHAKASDVLQLLALAQREVKKKFKVRLEPEIKIWK